MIYVNCGGRADMGMVQIPPIVIYSLIHTRPGDIIGILKMQMKKKESPRKF
jgi:hypothetical protein